MSPEDSEVPPECGISSRLMARLLRFCMILVLASVSLLASSQSTIVSAISGNWTAESTWVGGVIPGPADNVVISPLTTVTLTGLGPGFTVNNLNIMTGGVLNAENKILTVNGNLVVDGTYTSKNASSKDLEFYGSSISGSGSIKVDFVNMSINIHSNAVIEPSSQLIIYGNIRIFNNVTLSNSGQIEVTGDILGSSSSSVWNNSENSILLISRSLLSTGVLHASATGNTIEYNGQANQIIKAPLSTYYNIVIRGAGNKNLQSSIILDGNLDIRSTAVLATNNYSLELRGNWTNYSEFNEGNGEVIFSGNRVQVLSCMNDEVFSRLRIDKTGGELLLNTNVIISNMLTMNRGIINSTAFRTTLGTSTSSVGTLTWFNGFVKGKFEKWINNTGTIRFPVGGTSVQYILLDIAAFTNGGSLIAEFMPIDPGSSGLPIVDGVTTVRNTFVEGYWKLEPSNGFAMTGADNYSLRLLGSGFTSFPMGAETRILTRSAQSSPWTAEGTHVAGTAFIASRAAVASMPVQFALGDISVCNRPVTSSITGPAEVCSGDSPLSYSVVNSGNTFTWSVTGGTIVSGNGTSTVNVSWNTQGTDNAMVSVYETSCTRSLTVNLPVTIHTVIPETIVGALTVPENTPGSVYSVPARPGYIYQWNVTGGTQVSGGSSNSIAIDWGPAGMGSVAVIAEFPGCSLAPEVKINVRKYDVIESIASGDWNVESTWDCNCVPLPTQSVRIRNGHTIRLMPDGNQAINNLIIDIGGVFNHNNYAFRVHGDLIVNGTYSGSSIPLTLDGTDKMIDGVGTINGGFAVTGSKSISPTAILGINGNINLGSSVFITNNGIVKLAGNLISPDASSTWMNSVNSVLEITGALLQNGSLRASANGNRVNYTGAAQIIKTPFNSTYHDLIIDGSGTKTMSGSLVIDGDFTLEGSTLDVTNVNYQITLKGDWINNGGTFTARGGTVSFNGDGEQNVIGSEIFNNLTYTNSTGNLILSNNVTVGGVLTMSGLDIVTGSNILKIGSDAANSGSLVYESGIIVGKLERWVGSVGPLLFPVGVTGSYNPATITVNTITTGSLVGEFIPNDPGFIGLPVEEDDINILYQFSDGYWNFVPQNGFAPPSYSVSLDAGNFNSHSINFNTRVIKRTAGGPWILEGSHRDAVVSTVYRELLTGGLSAAGTQFGVGFVCETVSIVSLITHVSCNGEDNGAIDISVTGGASPYTYEWTPGGQTTQDIANLASGLYGVSVTDAENCITPAIFTVFQPLPLELTEDVTNATCGAPDNGAINITVYGGTLPYIYGWTTEDGSGLDYTAEDQTGLTAGNYRVLVLDMNGCPVTRDIMVDAAIGPPPAPSASVIVQPDCIVSTGTIEVTAPLGEYEFSIDGSTYQAQPVFENLAPGSYNVTARSIIDITCVSPPTILTVESIPFPPAQPVAVVTVQPTCSIPTGTVEVTSPLGTDWEYSLDGGAYQLLPAFAGVTPGNHQVTLRNTLEPTCVSAPAAVTVDPVPAPPAVPVTSVIVQPTCGSPRGSIEFVPQAGVEYSIGFGYQAGTMFPDLLPGTYTLSVRSIDDNSCITLAADPVTINPEPSAPDVPAALITTPPTCGTPFATLTITEPLGLQYEYNIDGGAYQTSPVITNVPLGDHILTSRLVAAPTCVSAQSPPITIEAAEVPAIPIAAVTEQPTCAIITGTITFTPQDDVEYSIGSGYQSDPGFTGVVPGTYTLSVRSTADNNCITFAASTLTINPVPVPPAQPVAVATAQPTCTAPTGTVTVTAPLGAEYEYSIDGGTYQAGAVFIGIAPGSHLITARLASSITCISVPSAPVQVDPVPGIPVVNYIKTDINCTGNATGNIDITISGGTTPYTYAWTGSGVVQGSEDQSGLVAGNYSVVVTDVNGCQSAPLAITITEPASAVSGSIASQTNVTINGGADGSVQVAGSGGTAPYMYSFDGGAFQVSGIFGSLSAGTYVVTVRDANLCTAPVPVVITEPDPLTGSISSLVNVDCFGQTTGSVTVTGTGGSEPYEYRLDGGSWQASGTFGTLAAGNFMVTVRDATMTTFDVPVTIFSPLEAVGGSIVSQSDALCTGTTTGSATLAGSGGIPPYMYSLDGGAFQSDPTFSISTGTHVVTIRDDKFCTFDINVVISGPAVALSGSITAKTDAECHGGSEGTVTALGSGGTGVIEYNLDGGTFQASGSFTNIDGGDHTITIRDANLCTVALPFTTVEPDAISISETHVSAVCPGDNSGSISLTISGGTGPYNVIWSDGIAGSQRTSVSEGEYSAVVTDFNGCAASVVVTVGVEGTEACLMIPEIITPNNDGYNDTWKIKNIDMFPDAEVMIFNRAGKRVYKAKNLLANPWDGRINGRLLPTDSYHYILDLHDGSKPRTGVVSIIR